MSFWIMMKLAVNSLYTAAIILPFEDPSSFLLLNLILTLGCSSTYSYRSGDLEQASLSLMLFLRYLRISLFHYCFMTLCKTSYR
ncbi:hypothetical protein ACU8KH_00106 [Lachancea thermotolerans]